jgi:A/G-specific adenine glycosylase
MEIQNSLLTQDLLPRFNEHVQHNKIDNHGIELFRKHIYEHYSAHARSFSWRTIIDPYRVVVSEVMLQQTQTERVKQKFDYFVTQLSDFNALADAPLAQVLSLWQGLGYNRRALALQKIAGKVTNEFQGVLPKSPDILMTFPGIGAATAASICTFAYNIPTIFIETNIRAVYIHLFLPQSTNINDKDILPLIDQTCDRSNPRQWYYALMDYGAMLKKRFKNPNHKSAHHTIQSKFEGSERQIRGFIIKVLLENHHLNFQQLCSLIPREPKRIQQKLNTLVVEQLITQSDNLYSIAQNQKQ